MERAGLNFDVPGLRVAGTHRTMQRLLGLD
jgi:hypothetical protein